MNNNSPAERSENLQNTTPPPPETLNIPLTPEEIQEYGIIVAHSMKDIQNKFNEDLITPGVMRAGGIINGIVKAWKSAEDWGVLKGARFLELEAGSRNGKNKPYSAELAAVNGAQVIAIDELPQTDIDQKLFTDIQADVIDLVYKGKLANHPDLKGKKFDIINAIEVDEQLEFHPRYWAKRNPDDFRATLLNQLKLLLAKDGIINTYHDEYYREVNGELVEFRNTS